MLNFTIDKIANPNASFPIGFPVFSVQNEEFWMLHELNRCKIDYIVNDVFSKIESVINNEIESFEFGYDATIIDFFKDRAIINYDYFEEQMEIPSSDIYQLMKDWRDALIEYKKS